MLAANDSRHGTPNAYNNLGCRCDRCKAAWRVYFNAYNHRTGRHKPRSAYLAELAASPPPHGTESRYTHRGCRCEECKRASRLARARRRAKVPA